MENLEKKYIELLLNRCLNFNKSKSLLIHCDLKEHLLFAQKVKEQALELGIEDICITINDLDETHDYLLNTPEEDIKINPIIDRTPINNYSLKGGALLFLSSSVPGLMNDIPDTKLKKLVDEREKTIKYYRSNVSKYTFPWCIACLPNERWAKTIFPNDNDAYNKLYLNIMKMCMIDKKDPIKEWDNYIKQNNYYKNKLNELNITTMHYRNSLGTDLTVTIPKGNIWHNLDKKDSSNGQIICNMPSYEIFTSPDYRMTNGIVYSSRPLYYNGYCIEDFYLIFKDGKVVSLDAKKGKNILEKIIFENKNCEYLGEVALVPYDSPISNTGLVFNETLFDENASCHLAIGKGFPRSFPNYKTATNEELNKQGLNIANTHVDFMIGTSDLEIEAETSEGKKLIFKNGNFSI